MASKKGNTKTATAENKAIVPTVLAFSRKIEPSDALMQAGIWQDNLNNQIWQNIELHDKSNRGVKSQYGVADEEKHQPNPVRGDDANLPHHLDTLKVSFTVKFLGDIAKATTNNDPNFGEKLAEKFNQYQNDIGFKELARRYTYNLANGRFLWRNRVGAENALVKITNTENKNQVWEFNALELSLNDFEIANQDLDNLAELIAKSFATGQYLLLKIEAFVKVGFGQRVFPSQEMRDPEVVMIIDDTTGKKVTSPSKAKKSKFLYQIKTKDGLCAGLHSEKIGNAIRTIDTWYADDEEFKSAIAIEPYGSVPTQGQAYRTSRIDLYTLLDNWLNDKKELSDDDKHFVVANLIRGGVFGGKD